jgi:hypothetical protein
MAAAAGIGRQWRRACWFFAGAKWDPDALGLAVARLIVKYLLSGDAPLVVAVDCTFFRRWGRHVFQARWAYDGAAQGGKKIAFGNYAGLPVMPTRTSGLLDHKVCMSNLVGIISGCFR